MIWYLSSQIVHGLIKQYFKIRVISSVIHPNTTTVTGYRRWCRLSVAQSCLAMVRDKRNALYTMPLFLYRHQHNIWLSLFLLWVMLQTWPVWDNFLRYRTAVTRYTIWDGTTEIRASIRLLNRLLRPDSIGTGIFLSPLLPTSWGSVWKQPHVQRKLWVLSPVMKMRVMNRITHLCVASGLRMHAHAHPQVLMAWCLNTVIVRCTF